MGFNTTVVVMNDALTDILDDKEFGASLYSSILGLSVNRGNTDVRAGSHCNAATAIETHHADGLNAVLVGGNTGYDMGYVAGYSLDITGAIGDDGKKRMLKQLAANLGFDISLRKRTVLP